MTTDTSSSTVTFTPIVDPERVNFLLLYIRAGLKENELKEKYLPIANQHLKNDRSFIKLVSEIFTEVNGDLPFAQRIYEDGYPNSDQELASLTVMISLCSYEEHSAEEVSPIERP